MFFNNKKQVKCGVCNSKIEDKFSFCPYCGSDLVDKEKESRDLGFLGKEDAPEDMFFNPQNSFGFGLTDKLIGSLFNTVMKSLDKQLKNQMKEFENSPPEIRALPNGIQIKIGSPKPKKTRKKYEQTITQEQLNKMSSLPRTTAKTNIRRLNNKIVYELNTPGVETPQDVFVSKTESGYEIKAIGSNKIYVNNLSIDLPLRSFSIADNKLLVEFHAE